MSQRWINWSITRAIWLILGVGFGSIGIYLRTTDDFQNYNNFNQNLVTVSALLGLLSYVVLLIAAIDSLVH